MTPDIFRRKDDGHLIKYFDTGGGMDVTGSVLGHPRMMEGFEIDDAANALGTTVEDIQSRLANGEKIHYDKTPKTPAGS